jgi:hypothetical protein
MFLDDEWTQEEFYEYKAKLSKKNIEIVLIDTILKPIKGIKTTLYNPIELLKYPKNTIFLFYCDTGKTTKNRLEFYKTKLKGYRCVSLRGGRGYFKPNLNKPFKQD